MQKQELRLELEIRLLPACVADFGKGCAWPRPPRSTAARCVGGESPSFGPVRLAPATTLDGGKVRLGGESPSFGPVRLAPATTLDGGKVRLGGESPSFGPVRHSAC